MCHGRPLLPTAGGRIDHRERARWRYARDRDRQMPPASTGQLIGRDEDLEQVTALLSTQDVRLVTVLGPGGIGKARFVAEVARRVGRVFPGGVA
jgi:ATP-dependent Clp protease ATP-binding subunit ClpA